MGASTQPCLTFYKGKVWANISGSWAAQAKRTAFLPCWQGPKGWVTATVWDQMAAGVCRKAEVIPLSINLRAPLRIFCQGLLP